MSLGHTDKMFFDVNFFVSCFWVILAAFLTDLLKRNSFPSWFLLVFSFSFCFFVLVFLVLFWFGCFFLKFILNFF